MALLCEALQWDCAGSHLTGGTMSKCIKNCSAVNILFTIPLIFRKEDSGNYSCQAYNVEGQQESVPEVLDVMCKFILKGLTLNLEKSHDYARWAEI